MNRVALKRRSFIKTSKPLKRGGFSAKVATTKRKKGLRKESKQKISVLQKRLWELCKQIIRKKYPNTCYTCGKTGLEGSNWQTGHLWAKASLGAFLKYDIRVLRPQCAICNLFYGGQGAIFYKKMLEEIGHEAMEQLEQDRQKQVKAFDHYMDTFIDYTVLLSSMVE